MVSSFTFQWYLPIFYLLLSQKVESKGNVKQIESGQLDTKCLAGPHILRVKKIFLLIYTYIATPAAYTTARMGLGQPG